MPAEHRLNLVLCWHMHQPEYRDPESGINTRPWTYLRAIKDYTDMAAHLEQVGNASAVVNFAPILLEQIDAYTQQIERYLNTGSPLRDPLLAALATEKLDPEKLTDDILKPCLDGHHQQFSRHHHSYAELIEFARHLLHHRRHIHYAGEGFFFDLLAWHHLAWLGETVHRNDPRVQQLMRKERHFSTDDRRELLAIIGEQIAAIVPRYRALAESGRVELSMTPYAHPLAPLLLEWQSAHQATSQLPLPHCPDYPGGAERLRWHIDTGIDVFKSHFNCQPVGCWPAEGALSDASLHILDQAGFRWAASGAGVLFNSLQATQPDFHRETALFHPYQVEENSLACFFRDDQLSDLIGFTYSNWHADDAVANLIHHLEEIAKCCATENDAVAAIIMDGENAWEHYPYNGFYFLQGLYRRLANHPKIRLTTFSQCLEYQRNPLSRLVAGSWVYGNLTTWIGSPEKNRAWEMLVAAKETFDQTVGELEPQQANAAARQLAVCEGSDWFWWPGGDNPRGTVADFDILYRRQLSALYQLLNQPVPDDLAHPFTGWEASGHEATDETPLGGVMRKSQ